MSREYRFRLWSKEDKAWANPQLLEVWDNKGKLEPFQYIQSGDLTPLYIPRDNYLIQQSIGLKDCLNVEVYEGDIIENQAGRQFIVEWVGISFQFREIEHKDGKVKTDAIVSNIGDITHCCRVVGNICESPSFIITPK